MALDEQLGDAACRAEVAVNLEGRMCVPEIVDDAVGEEEAQQLEREGLAVQSVGDETAHLVGYLTHLIFRLQHQQLLPGKG